MREIPTSPQNLIPWLKLVNRLALIFMGMLLLLGIVLVFINKQLSFVNGRPQNTLTAAYFIFALGIIAIEFIMVILMTIISLILWIKLSKIKKYLTIHGKQIPARITKITSLGGSYKFFYIIRYDLEYEKSNTEIIDFTSNIFKQKPGDLIQILIDPQNNKLASFIGNK